MFTQFIEAALTFLILTGFMLGTLFIYVFYKGGWTIEGFKKNWEASEGHDKPVIKGVGFILGVPLLTALVLFLLNTEVEASEIKWFDEATVYVGLDITENPSPLCKQGGVNDRLTSNMGFTQSIVKKDVMNIHAKYTHHSCAVSADKNSYDSIGLMIEWTIK